MKGLRYYAMIGNNLSQFDAAQLDNDMNTFSGELVWTPTTGECGRANGFGDFEGHEKVATPLAVHFTRSDENRQGQPDTEAFENSQIRVSDGSIVFSPSLFGEGILIGDVRYRMTSTDAGVKYRGFALEREYYWRVVDNFRRRGVEDVPFEELNDTGFQLQGSAMLLPKTVSCTSGAPKSSGSTAIPGTSASESTDIPGRTPSCA